MYFFAVIFIVIIIVGVNIYAKGDPISRDKISFKRTFDKELCEPNEIFLLRTEINNMSSHPMGRIYVKHTLDEDFVLNNESRYKVITSKNNKQQIICRTHVRAKRTGVVETRLSIPRRGVFSVNKINIDCLDLLGFHTSYYEKEKTEKIIVAPKRVSNKFMSKMIAQGYGDFNAKRGFINDETTIRTYAEYTGHEPMRHINWKKSAQSEDFIVKQFEPMGIHVTTIVFDISGFINVKHDSMQGELLEYSISMLREMFEYFEVKRIPYCLYTNARSSYIHENVFRSTPSGKKTRRIMLSMLGELSVDFNNKKYPLKSKELLDLSIKNSFRAPFAYVAPSDRSTITTTLKKASKIKGVEIIELYAKDYFKVEVKS